MNSVGQAGASRAVLVGFLLASASAGAQSVGEALEEIVVTARKQSESAQDVPLSITVFSSDQLRQLGLTGVNDIALRTPGLQYGNFGDVKLSPTSLRGVFATSDSAGADPAVGIYIDEVYIGQGAGATFDLHDIERVEVLRGPQGTLFGRNTIGGVINITTKRPSDVPEASAEVNYGNFDYVRAGATVSGPLGAETVAGRLSAVYEDRSGTSDNVWLNQDVNTREHWSMRGQLQFQPSETSELLLSADYYDLDQSPLAFETLSYNDAALLPQVIDLFGLPRNTRAFDRKVYGDERNEETLELWGVAGTLRTLVGAANLTGIVSYRSHDYYNRSDTDRSPVSSIYDGDPEDVDRLSAEVRLDWTVGEFNWLTGLYYYDQDATNLSFVEVGSDLATLLEAPEVAGFKAGSDASMTAESIGIFGSVTWAAGEAVDVTLGGRYTYEEKEIDYVQVDPLDLLGGDFAVQADDSWSQFTPSASLQYRFTPLTMGYVTISNGFKSGGFNDALGSADGIGFDPEELWNYEAGFKGQFLDRRLIANAAIFRMDWRDIQITNDNPATPIYDPTIVNAGKAHSHGVEFELQALVTDRVRIDANLSVQEAEYDEGSLPTGEPLRKIPFAPEYSGTFTAEYRQPVGDGSLFVLGQAVLAGSSYLTPDNQRDGRVDAYQLYSARMGYSAAGDRWTVTLWGENLGDEDVKQRLFDLSELDVVGQKFIALNDPRTYGVTLRFNYR